MDPIHTLLLARTHTVILDADRVAAASTRPARHGDVDRFEAELVELGYVMSLDLAMMIRRLPQQAIEELRTWIVSTLARPAGAHRPNAQLSRAGGGSGGRGYSPAAPSGDGASLYARRVMGWLLARPEQPCPWCGRRQAVGALDPCGHLVCRSCWAGGSFSGCPVCHRRVSPHEPFLGAAARPSEPAAERAARSSDLRILHLAVDVLGVARDRFERMLSRPVPLSKEDRTEVEAVIDTMGPKAAAWLPRKIPVKETMALAVARLWMVSPDRRAMAQETQPHLRTATDVLRVAAVLMDADPALEPKMRFRSIGRGLRRAVLEVLNRLPVEGLVEDMRRHAGLWKRAGERLHPFELAEQLPGAALAFAALRETDLGAASFGEVLRAKAAGVANVRISDGRVQVVPWAGAVEEALRTGDAQAAAARLEERPAELLRRADHVMRVAAAGADGAALAEVLAAIRRALPRGGAAQLLALASHIARREAAWPRRVFFPRGDALRAWTTPDRRRGLPAEAAGAIALAARAELVARAEGRPRFARAVLDRGLADLLVPINERTHSRAKIAWPRGSAVAVPVGPALRLFLHWEDPPGARVDLDLSVALYDAAWRHVGTCDPSNVVIAGGGSARAAVHSGDVTSAPPPLGGSELVDLDVPALTAAGVRHVVVVVHAGNNVPLEVASGFMGLLGPPSDAPFDPRTAAPRFDLHGQAATTVPFAIDLETRRARWLEVHVKGRAALRRAGGFRAALAHLGQDFAHLVDTGARPTLWELACIHAAARANTVYVRGPEGLVAYRRRDGEPPAGRLARLLAGDHDGAMAAIPPANAPTWVALLRDDLVLPAGSAGYILDARSTPDDGLRRSEATDLVADLAPRG